ncbi:MAG: TolC family protein, partial [Deltaproteobacteria bacterium]|nr:TolC family protein [Deltaproteobacteria bacterium]
AQRTRFFPTLNTSYRYTRSDETAAVGGTVLKAGREHTFAAGFTQPVFTGFSLLNQYKIADLGLDVSVINEKRMRQDIILEAKTIFFDLLQNQKLVAISEATVTQIAAQKDVAESFYNVGMSPLNDFLQAQVELANAEQELIVTKNNLENAQANFNVLLRRPINAPVQVKDILDYSSFEHVLDDCLFEAEKNRLEIQIADKEVEISRKEIELVQKDYWPSVNLEGNYFFNGTDWDADGGPGVSDPEGWTITALASWNFWEWGRTTYGKKEKMSRLAQAELQKAGILDSIHLEVKNAYNRTQEAEKAIVTIEKAIEQAKENFRINEERYKEQMATSTDVLIAQTLLSRTMTNYYNALYAFKKAKASLYRAIGREVMQ